MIQNLLIEGIIIGKFQNPRLNNLLEQFNASVGRQGSVYLIDSRKGKVEQPLLQLACKNHKIYSTVFFYGNQKVFVNKYNNE